MLATTTYRRWRAAAHRPTLSAEMPAAWAARSRSSAICGLVWKNLVRKARLGPPVEIIGPFHVASTGARRWVGWHGRWRPTQSRQPGNCPACQVARNTAAPPQPNGCSFSGNPCHQQTGPGSAHGTSPPRQRAAKRGRGCPWCKERSKWPVAQGSRHDRGGIKAVGAGEWVADDRRSPKPDQTLGAEGSDCAHGVQGNRCACGGEEAVRQMGKTERRKLWPGGG